MKPKQDLFNYDGHFNTRSGIKFSICNPTIDMVNIYDIAHSLSHVCRFGGQLPFFYSVAQHCLHVVDLMEKNEGTYYGRPAMLLAGLLHDAPEAYIGDVIKPLKIMLPEYVNIERNMMRVIFNKFDLSLKLLPWVKPFDRASQVTEFKYFFEKDEDCKLERLTPDLVADKFLTKFKQLNELR